MITGDNPLTACHVARQLKFCRTTTTLILTQGDDTTWSWLSVDHSVTLPLTSPDVVSRKNWSQFLAAHDLCLTGEGLAFLMGNHLKLAKRLLPHIRVFARVNPKQKEAVVTTLKALGYTTLMCGDGTNDVGALKHSNVGVAILSSAPVKKKAEKKEQAGEVGGAGEGRTENDKFDKLKRDGKGKRPGTSGEFPRKDRLTAQQAKLERIMKELQEA